jgi:O-antigen/teichoic acid export membrane protein
MRDTGVVTLASNCSQALDGSKESVVDRMAPTHHPCGSADDLLTRNSIRSARAKKNVVASLIFKGIGVSSNFLLVRMAITYVSPAVYGIWLTLYSVLSWTQFLDIGLGNGLRNRFAEALAQRQPVLARRYVSTAYAVLSAILATAFVIFMIASPFVDWTFVFNAPKDMRQELYSVVRIVFTFFILRFLLQLIGCILTGDQRPAMNSFLGAASNIATLVVLFALSRTARGSLLGLGSVCSSVPVVVFLLASILLYSSRYKQFSPSLRYVDWAMARDLTSLGLRFFVIQLACLVMYCTSNMIIAQLQGPKEVTAYNVAYMYFSTTVVVFGVIVSPFWSAATDAFVHGDVEWMQRSAKGLLRVFFFMAALAVVMCVMSDPLYRLWVGSEIKVPRLLSVFMTLYAILLNWSSIFSSLINGMGKIRLSLWLALCCAVINIPLSIFFAHVLGLGSSGVVLATCVCLLVGCIILPIQYRKILGGSATGIWNQ